jgi:lipoprotein-anchoring transpeptidase ErfK/SrfK
LKAFSAAHFVIINKVSESFRAPLNEPFLKSANNGCLRRFIFEYSAADKFFGAAFFYMQASIVKNTLTAIALLVLASAGFAQQQQQQQTAYVSNAKRQSARSDKLTGGTIEKAALRAGAGDVKITVNVPAFQLTLWQGGKEVKTYWVGVGMKEFPIYIGVLEATSVVWNPPWIPPDSDWVKGHKGVKVGEVIPPTDARNPIGKMKIPLGYGFLIHQAKGINDLGSLVSHGCVRMLQTDLYDLGERIVAANSLPVSAKQINQAKSNKKTLTVAIDPSIPVEITYDTAVVEAGRLHIYPDVYDRAANTIANLRDELETSGIKSAHISDAELENILKRAVGKTQYVVSVENIRAGRESSGGQTMPVVGRGAARTSKPKSSNGTLRQRKISR